MKTLSKVVMMLMCFTIVIVKMSVNHNDQMKGIQEIKISIEKRNHLDTLYWNHLENCAFIQKDSIGVGYQSYLYSKYHRKYKIKE